MNIKSLEKTAGPIGDAIGRVTSNPFARAAKIIVTHPRTTFTTIGGLAAIGYLLDRANKVRGMHQILSEAHKARIMDQQSILLNRIAKSVEQKPERRPASVQMPIIPPLR